MAFTAWRDVYRRLAPGWLTSGDGEAIGYTLAITRDAWLERMRQSATARFPSLAPDDALPLIARGRGLVRGRSEGREAFVRRLIAWRYPRGHRVRGSAWGLLAQLWAYWDAVNCATIDVSGNFFEVTEEGAEGHMSGVPWDWDTRPAAEWSRFWILLDLSSVATDWADWGDPGVWGGALGTPGTTIGLEGVTPDDWQAVRGILYGATPWRPAGSRAEWIVVVTDPAAVITPTAAWEYWHVVDGSGNAERARAPDARYIGAHPTRQIHTPRPEGAPTAAIRMPDDALYTPTPAAVGLLPMPDGSDYTPTPRDIATIRLPDDGDLPS